MKYLKTYEGINFGNNSKIGDPKIGDYVICKEDDLYPNNKSINLLMKFLNENIGQCINIVNDLYYIEYNNIPELIEEFFRFDKKTGLIEKKVTNCRCMRSGEIIYFSSDREDLETILNVNKYNL